MTNEELQMHIAAINAAISTGQIEEKSGCANGWKAPSCGRVIIGKSLSEEGYALRIKPKPRQVFISANDLHKSGSVDAWLQDYRPAGEFICFREVLE